MTININPTTGGEIRFKATPPTADQRDPQAPTQRLRKACVQFEALFMNYMLKVMRESAEPLEKSEEGMTVGVGFNNPFQDLFDWHIAQEISEQSPLGVVEQLMRRYAAAVSEGADNTTGMDPNQPLRRFGASDEDDLQPNIASIVRRAAMRYKLDPRLIDAVIQAESGGDTTAVSRAGAKGLMQLMDSTAVRMGVSDPFDPEQNITGGAAYLKSLIDLYRGDIGLALAAYNAGPGAVDRYGGIPPYPETTRYVRTVLEHYRAAGTDSKADRRITPHRERK